MKNIIEILKNSLYNGLMKENFEYSVIRSDRRTLCIEITREKKVIVRAPKRISDEKIAECLAAENTQEIAETLVCLANENGGRDNITAVVIARE